MTTNHPQPSACCTGTGSGRAASKTGSASGVKRDSRRRWERSGRDERADGFERLALWNRAQLQRTKARRIARQTRGRAGTGVPHRRRGSLRKSGQKVPQGYYNLELMLRSVTQRGGVIGVCGTCMDARGITDDELAAGCHRSTMDELTEWTRRADQVLVF